MQLLLRNGNNMSNNGSVMKLFLVLFIIQLILLSGFYLPEASAAGGDLKFPAASDTPQAGKQEARASVVDSAGNLIVTGYQNLGVGTDDDYLTVKFNPDGTVAWRKTYNRAGGSDQAVAIVLDSSDNVVVTGIASNGVNKDIYTIKYSGTDGTKLWDHTYDAPANGDDTATCIAIDNLDNVYVGGYVQTAAVYEDYVVLKYSVNGPTTENTPIWVAPWSSVGVDKLNAIAAGVGGVAVTGQSWNGTDFDVMTVKYDYNGTKLWERRYSSSGQYPDLGRNVAIDSSGKVLITASVANNGALDIYTAQYPAGGGAAIWEKTYENPTHNDEPYALILDSSDNVYVTGYTFSVTGNEDLLVVRYKGADGAKEWEKIYDSGASALDIGTEMLLDSADNLYVTGFSTTTGGNTNILTLKIKNDPSNPALYWSSTFDGPAGKSEKPVGMGTGIDDDILVGGWSDIWTSGASDYDYLMLAYDPGLINPPSSLTATVLSDTSVKIDWTDNSANEDGFRIERKLTELGTWSEIGTVAANIATFTDTGLTPNNTYYYRLRSYNAANGSSNPSEEIRVLSLYVTYKAPVWSYQYNSPDNLDDYAANGIASGSDNNPVITGYSMLSTSGFDYYTIKLDNSAGSLIWSHRYDDADNEFDRATSVTVDSANAAIVTGYSSLFYAPAGGNINSIFTLKYPASCAPPTPCEPAPLWGGQYNGPGARDDRAVSIATTVDSSNNVAVVGYGKNAAENEDIYLMKYAANPALDGFGKAIPEWSANPYNYSFNGDDIPAAIAFDNDGNIFIAGSVQSGSAPSVYKSFVAKYCGKSGAPCNGKAPGEIIWEDSFTGSGDNKARSLAVDINGDLYVAGYDTGANGTDLLIVKYDGKAVPTGSRILWSKTVDGVAHGDDSAVSVKYDQVDNSVVVGGTTLTSTGNHDFIIIRYNSAGVEQWRKIHLRPDNDEEATAMAMDVSGNVSIAGYTSNGTTNDAISVEYDYEGILVAATIFNGSANSYDEALAITFNPKGDTLVAGYTTNAAGNADYLVYKGTGLPLQASAPFSASQYYTKVDLTWADTSTGETGFYVERKTGACDSVNSWELIYTAPANTTTYSNTGLNAGQEYCYRVRSFKSGEIDPRWVERYALLDNPVPPGAVTPTAVNTTRINLTWQDNTTGETGFRIFRCAGAGCSSFTEIDSVLSNIVTYSDTTVAAGTSYSYRILSYKTSDWESAFSTVATTTTPSATAPAGLTATRASEGQINLSWADTNSDETGFKIERCEGSGCSSYAQVGTVAADVLTFNDTLALKAETTYRYQVRAYKTATPSSWDGPYSDGAEATTTLMPTSGLSASPADTTTINLSWVDNTGAETGFKVERCLNEGCSDFAEVGQTASNVTTLSDSSVCNNSTYTYRVSAINTGLSMDGGGDWTKRKPLTITNFQPNFQTKVTVSFASVPGAQADFDDIRFYDETAKREVPYYLESKTNSSTATFYIKTGVNNNISIYYANPSALSGSTGASVFELFDDFDSLAAWTVSGSSVTASGGMAKVDPVSTTAAALYRNFNVPYPYIAETRYLYPTADTYRNRLSITTSAGTGSPTVDYGIFNYSAGNEQVNWNGWTWKYLSINTWYILQWEVTDSNYTFSTFNSAGTQISSNSTGATIADLKRAYFAGAESATSDFNLDWFRIRKYAATVPTVTLGSEVTSAGYTFDNTWTGVPSATAFATTTAPVAPTNPSATRISEARIDLAWTDTTSDETGFKIERCKGDACSDFVQIGTAGSNVTAFSDTTPMDVESTYRYRIMSYKTATCSGGWDGPYSGIVSAVTTVSAPTGLSATASVSSFCDDLRFTDSDGSTLLNYYVQSGCGTPSTRVWLKFPSLATGDRSLYLYWANPVATAMSNGTAIFDFFDDFNGSAIDTGKWTITDSTGFSVSNGFLHGSNTTGRLTSKTTFSSGTILQIKAKTTAIASPNGQMIGGFFLNTSNGIGWLNHPGETYYRKDGSWINKGTSQTPFDNMIYTISVKDGATVNLQMYDQDTSTMFWDAGDIANAVSGEPIVLGKRFDNLNPGQIYATDWDWIRTRQYVATPPTAAVGDLQSGTYSLTGGTWYARRPITLTNSGAALTNYQQGLTIDTSNTAFDRIALAWSDNTASETGFIIERCTGATCDFSSIDTFSAPSNATSYDDKSVAMSTTYCYRVKAEKSAVWSSAASNTVCAETSTLAAPVLAATATTSINLSWSDPNVGEDGFTVERCTGVSCDFSSFDSGFPVTLPPNTTGYVDTNVCSDIYRYRLQSFKVGPKAWSIYSNIVSANTVLPSAPGGLGATRISEVQINLAWADNTTDETGFRIERCTGDACDFSVLDVGFPQTVLANLTSYQDTGLTPETSYRYRVYAYKTAACSWESAASNISSAMTSVSAPASLAATTPKSTQVDLTWTGTDIATETGFSIMRCSGVGCTPSTVVETAGTNAVSWSDNGVCQNTDYVYGVRALNGNGGFTYGGGSDWTKRRPLTITNFQANTETLFTLSYVTGMNSDFSDIRFYDETAKVEIPYWVESKTNGASANVWIKTGGNNNISMYYGNATATSTSNAGNVFLFYEDFNYANLSDTNFTSKWTVNDSTGFSFVGGALRGTTNKGRLTSKATFSAGSTGIIQEIKANSSARSADGSMIGGFFKDFATAFGWLNHGGVGIYCNNGTWTSMVGLLPINSNLLYTTNVKNGTTINPKVTYYDTGTVFQDIGNLTNTVSNAPIALGLRYDGYQPNQTYSTDWDWIRVRAYTAITPTVTPGAEEATGPYNMLFPPVYAGATATVAIKTPILAAPSSITVVRSSETQINLGWGNVTGETGFEVDRCVGSLCDFNSKTTFEFGQDVTSYQDKGLLPNTTYRYRVRAKTVGTCPGYSSYNSLPKEATTTVTAPNALTATMLNTTQINLAWYDNTTADTGFKIERCSGMACSAFSQIDVTGPSATSYTDTSVCPNTVYNYRIAAINGGLSNDGAGCWTKRKPVTVASFVANVQTKVVVPYDSDMNSDFSDIRFYDPVTYQELPHWLESKTDGTTATFWVKMSSGSSIYMYYGNSSATSSSNGAATFQFFDDFSGTTINPSKWTIVGNPTFYSQNDEFISTGGTGGWDSGMYSVPTFSRNGTVNYIFEIDHLRSAGGNMMIGVKNTGTGISYTDFNYAAYPVYDGNGNRLLVYEDGNWRGDNLKAISSNVWQYYKFETLYPGAKFYHGDSPSAYTSYYTSAYNATSPQRIGFTNANMSFKLDNARVRTYANPEPVATVGAEESNACYSFTGVYVSGYSNTASATTPPTAAPTTLLATATTDTNINLTWTDASNDEMSFRLQRCSDAVCSSSSDLAVLGANRTTYSDTVSPATNYCYRIRAEKTAACSTGWPTAWSNITCDLSFEPRTDSFTATATGPFAIHLEWNDLAQTEDGYLLQVRVFNNKWATVATIPSNTTTYLDRVGIEPQKSYTYRIRPYRGSDNSPFVWSNTVTTPEFSQGAGTCP